MPPTRLPTMNLTALRYHSISSVHCRIANRSQREHMVATQPNTCINLFAYFFTTDWLAPNLTETHRLLRLFKVSLSNLLDSEAMVPPRIKHHICTDYLIKKQEPTRSRKTPSGKEDSRVMKNTLDATHWITTL